MIALLCPVCLGLADGPMAQSSNAGIATLMGVTLVVLSGIGWIVWSIARHSR